jgi:hypothetical protein
MAIGNFNQQNLAEVIGNIFKGISGKYLIPI